MVEGFCSLLPYGLVVTASREIAKHKAKLSCFRLRSLVVYPSRVRSRTFGLSGEKRLLGFQTPLFCVPAFRMVPSLPKTWKRGRESSIFRREAERSPRSIFPRDRPGHNPRTTVAGCPRPLPGTRRRAAPVNSPVATETPHDRFSENRIYRSLRRLADPRRQHRSIRILFGPTKTSRSRLGGTPGLWSRLTRGSRRNSSVTTR